jgi:hypothetical protein
MAPRDYSLGNSIALPDNTDPRTVKISYTTSGPSWSPLGTEPTGLYVGIKMDAEGLVMATLTEAQVEAIAQRVVELLYERNRRGESNR